MVNIEDMSKESLEKYYQRKYGKSINECCSGESLVKKEFFEIPENITLDVDGDILFNNCKQMLHIYGNTGLYEVCSYLDVKKSHPKEFVLVPCEREDLKTGDTAYRTDREDDDFTNTDDYCKILDEERYVRVFNNRNVMVCSWCCKYWFKVVPREEVE